MEGAEGMRDLEDDEAGSGGSIQSLGWKRWKRVFVRYVPLSVLLGHDESKEREGMELG